MKRIVAFALVVGFGLVEYQPAGLSQVGPQQFYVPDQVVVSFEPETPSIVRELTIARVFPIRSRQRRFATNLHVLDFSPNTDLDAVIRELEASPGVKLAVRNAILQLSITPNDTHFSQQWNMHSGSDIDMDCPEAWDKTTGSSTVKVAVIDTGVDTNHEDLAANLLAGQNVALDNSDVSDSSLHSHGTANAGIIGAIGNNAKGVAGVAWNTKILPVVYVTYWSNGNVRAGGNDADLADAIVYARVQEASIVNISANAAVDIPLTLGQIQLSPSMLFVFAAGNSGSLLVSGVDIDTATTGTRYPCTYGDETPNPIPNVICVAAANSSGNKALFSNWGAKTVHIGAPGTDIFSTMKGGNVYGMPGPTDTMGSGNGTSYAAPHVTGIAALMKAANPTYTVSQLKENLLLAAQPTPTGDLDIGTPQQPHAERVHSGGMANAWTSVYAYGDSFDDGEDSTRFFSNEKTGARWGVAQNGSALCDLLVKTVSGTADRTLEARFSGRAGDSGSNWTVAGYKIAYPPGNNVQSLVLRVNTIDGTDFVGKRGRIGIGVIGETGQSGQTCSGNGYTQINFGGSMIAGVELDTGKPFIYFDPPYTENLYSPINLTGVKKLSISLFEGFGSANLYISNSVTGEQLFSQTNITYPSNWSWTGTDKPAIVYFGVTAATSGTLNVRSFVSVR